MHYFNIFVSGRSAEISFSSWLTRKCFNNFTTRTIYVTLSVKLSPNVGFVLGPIYIVKYDRKTTKYISTFQ